MLSAGPECPLCGSIQREKDIICVVSQSYDVVAIEESGQFKGLYHVLGGELSPLDGIGPEDLTIDALESRIRSGEPSIREVILATNPTLEGEATALYLAKLLHSSGVLVTRIARGIPVGGDLEYANSLTLGNAMADRSVFDSL
jgi:recombination protein RecR